MLVTVGRIGRAHGIRGDVTVDVRTDSPAARFIAGAVLTTDPATAGPLTVAKARWHSGRLLVLFEGVRDRNGAEALRGVYLLADLDESERLDDPDEFYDHQLAGLAVHLHDGTVVGEVTEVVHLPGHDLLAIRRPDGREALVPFVTEIVPEVDVDAGHVLVDPPAGLLDTADAPGTPP